MKRLLNELHLYVPIIVIVLILIGFLGISRTGDLLLTQFYFLYVTIIVAGFAIIKYMHRDIALIASKYIYLDIKVKSIVFVILVFTTLVFQVIKLFHISILIIFYLLILVFIVELVTLRKALQIALKRERNEKYTGTHLRS